jgi:Mlc titration factor MtfA (ptsG expression regulator)
MFREGTIYFFILLFLLLVGGLINRVRYASRKKKVRAWGFPLAWLPMVERGLSVYPRLPLDLREKLQQIAFFKINDLFFDGLGVYENLPDEIKVSLGAHIGLLHANIRIPPIPSLRAVVIGTTDEIEATLATTPQAWGASVLVTAWDPAAGAARMFREERDPELIEHWNRLAPGNDGKLFFAGWARSLHNDSPRGRARATEFEPTLAENSSLFAAATEVFVQHPAHLAKHHPEIYDGLRAFYRLDPVRWTTT